MELFTKTIHLEQREEREEGHGRGGGADLFTGQAGVTKHSDLIRDVVPAAGGSQVFNVLTKIRSHGHDSREGGTEGGGDRHGGGRVTSESSSGNL
jgi:hypothetical protein